MDWTKAAVGCYWDCGDYTIATVTGGGAPSGYQLTKARQPIGRYLTVETAQRAAAEDRAFAALLDAMVAAIELVGADKCEQYVREILGRRR